MWIRDWMVHLHIDDSSAVAGFAGGVVNVFRAKLDDIRDILGSLISGSLIAVYLGQPLAELSHLPDGIEWKIATSFIVGYGGLELLGYIYKKMKERFGAAINGGKKDA